MLKNNIFKKKAMPTVAMNESDTISKKRTSLSHFLQGIPPTLKRKRSYCSSDTAMEQVLEPPKKKKMMNRVTELIQKMAVTISSSVQPHRNHQKKKYSVKRPSPDNALTLFQDHFSLPTIEWTNGSLGIILSEGTKDLREEKEEEDDDESIYLEFPTPPPKVLEQYNNIIRRNKKRQDSCPPRFHSMIESCHTDSSSSMLPLTPTTTTSSSSSTMIETETQFILKIE